AHASGVAGTNQQDRSQRRPRHRTDDAGGALSTSACEDAAQSEAAHAADPSQAFAVRNFGLKVGMAGATKFEGRIKELIENLPDLGIKHEPRNLASLKDGFAAPSW